MEIRPFSNSSEFECWLGNNCYQCEEKERLIEALRVLYRKVRDSEIEFKDEIQDTFIGAFAGSGVRIVNCSAGSLNDIARLGKFLKENDIIYTW
ncbi:MAG: hypothetical protein WBA41_00700 [Rivularia sp. (in: cyanobacteria)]